MFYKNYHYGVSNAIGFRGGVPRSELCASTHLCHAQFGKGPERPNAVQMFFHERTDFHDDESDDGGNHRGPCHHKASNLLCRTCH